MTNALLFSFGLVLFLVGLAFFYSPHWILRVNRLARDWVFNDNYVVVERNKRAVLCLLLAFFFFYWGYLRAREAWRPFVSTDRMLYQSLQDLHARNYAAAKAICQRVLARHPDNAEAMYQLSAAEYLMRNIEGGRTLWRQAVEMDPRCANAAYLRNLVLRDKSSDLPDPGFEVR